MSAYLEYKKCEGDWIKETPVDWEIIRGKYLFEIKKRIVGELDHDVLSITQKGIKVKDTESGDGQLSMDYSKYQIVESGDFAMNHMDLLTGYVDISKFNGVTSPDYRVFSAKEEASCPRFFLYVFQMGYTNKIFFKYGQGASHLGRWRLPTDGFNNFWFPCPPKEDRETIVDYLDYEIGRIDTLIKKQQQLIKLLKEKRQAVISHAVTKGLNPNAPMRDSGVEWLGEVPEHWDVLSIKHIVSIPVTDGPHETPTFLGSGVPFISAEAVSSGRIDFEKIRAHISEEVNERYSQKYSPKKYDIYMVKSGATTGVTAIVETDIKFNIWSPLAVIRCKEDSYPYFVLNFMRSFNFQEAVELNWNFGTQQNIGMGVIENLHVTRPPIDEAKLIAKELDEKCTVYDDVIEKANIQIELSKERRTALISAAVTGKIDVRKWQAPMDSRLRGNDGVNGNNGANGNDGVKESVA